jgi:hypothetical protein
MTRSRSTARPRHPPCRPGPSRGLGLATEALYAGNTNPAPASYRFGPLSGLLRQLPSGFKTGKRPDTQELVGRHAQQWTDVAASVYEYIEQKYGINQMIASAILVRTRFSTPFGNVEDVPKSTAGTLYFFKTATVGNGWRAWLKRARPVVHEHELGSAQAFDFHQLSRPSKSEFSAMRPTWSLSMVQTMRSRPLDVTPQASCPSTVPSCDQWPR